MMTQIPRDMSNNVFNKWYNLTEELWDGWMLSGQMVINNSIDSHVEEKDDATSEAEVLNKINASCLPLHKLALKPGACTI